MTANERSQTWRVEVRFDVTGTPAQRDGVIDRVLSAVRQVDGTFEPEVTEVLDENWEEPDEDYPEVLQ